MGQRMVLAALAGLLGLSACNDEGPPDFGVMDTPLDMGQRDDMGPPVDMALDMTRDQMVEVDASRCPPPVFTNDVARYTADVANPLFQACSLCHSNPDAAPEELTLTGDGATDAAEAATFVEPDCLFDPATCEIIAWHPEAHPGYVEDPLLSAMVGWLEASTTIEPCPDGPPPQPVDMGPTGPPEEVPCEALPPEGADLARSEDYRREFEQPDNEGVSHNDILVGSCARNGTCHAIAAEGDGYWLIEGEDECATNWNFFITQIYIDLLDPRGSPLLTLPRDNRGHGGRSVFQGADDPRHVRLLRWIQNEVNRSP